MRRARGNGAGTGTAASPQSTRPATPCKALPGVFTTIQGLAAGRYEVRLWACADVGARARVCCGLAGAEAGAETVADEWKQVRFAVRIPEKPQNAVLRIWVATPDVRVWLDDVEVEPAR